MQFQFRVALLLSLLGGAIVQGSPTTTPAESSAPATPAPNPSTSKPVFSPSSGGKLLAILLYHYS